MFKAMARYLFYFILAALFVLTGQPSIVIPPFAYAALFFAVVIVAELHWRMNERAPVRVRAQYLPIAHDLTLRRKDPLLL